MMGFITAAVISAFVVGEILTFWDELIDILKKAVESTKALVKGVYRGVKAFVQNVVGAFREVIKHYSKSDEQWYVTEQTRPIRSDEVPDDIRRDSKYGAVDVTDELELRMTS